jgi:hypothetical protein
VSLLSQFEGLLLLIAMLAPLLILQRALHTEIQVVFLLVTRNASLTIWFFALLFFPGIFLHESSHFAAAKLLRVRTGRFSLRPRPMPGGRLQLGSVEVAQADVVRDSIIGIAPLIAGGFFIAYAAIYQMRLLTVWEFLAAGQVTLFGKALALLPHYAGFWLWLYLVFVVSSTMMPSASDRHSWLPLIEFALLLVALAILAGGGTWMLQNLAPPLNAFLKSVSLIFGLSVVLHLILLAPTMLMHRILTSVTGLDVN